MGETDRTEEEKKKEKRAGERWVSYLRRGQVLQGLVAEGHGEQPLAQDGAQVSGHDGLLLHGAMVLQ